ncbi:hypothetical protein ABBQ32_007809 [Trebouxia sp. C0010 RCD-2024]
MQYGPTVNHLEVLFRPPARSPFGVRAQYQKVQQFTRPGFAQQQQQQQQQQRSLRCVATRAGLPAEVEKLLRDPMLQKAMYPKLPESMRNPEALGQLFDTPEFRAEIEQFIQGQLPETQQTDMKEREIYRRESEEQLKDMDMDAVDVYHKIKAEPALAKALEKPEVQAALEDCFKNPRNISKYVDDPEIEMVLTKMEELFPEV